MPLFGLDTGCPASTPRHRFTLTRLPEPSVLVPIGTDLAESSWGGPSSFGSSPRLRCPPQPESWCEPDRLADVPSTPGCPVASNASAGLRLLRPPEGARRPGLTRRPPRSPVTFADSSSSRPTRRSSVTRSEVAVNTVRAPTPLSPREQCGLGRSPLLTAPVGVRSPERASVNTPQNPWSRGISKNTGLSPKLSLLPPGSAVSSTRCPLLVHSDMHRCGARPPVAGRPVTAAGRAASSPTLAAPAPVRG